MKHILAVIPVITEKSMGLAGDRWYSFKVDVHLSKPQIANAIEDQFKVHVTKVKTMRVRGKTKLSGRKRLLTTQADWKKAIVKLKDNEKIDLFSVEEKPVIKK